MDQNALDIDDFGLQRLTDEQANDRGGPHCLDSLTADLRWKPPSIMPPALQDNLPVADSSMPHRVAYSSKHHLGSSGQGSDAAAVSCNNQSSLMALTDRTNQIVSL